jgi:glycosyltransferase involved in cell wall biosynthesis
MTEFSRDNPLISAIIPVYNAAKYLRECVDSVREQSFAHIEIILVDDGSTDGSAAICDLLAQDDPRIVVLHKENGGVSSARNAGLAIAKGDFLAFLDCDDFIQKEMYRTLLDCALDRDADIVVSSFFEERPDGSLLFEDTGLELSMTGEEATAAILGCIPNRTTHRMLIWFFAWNKLYRAKILKDVFFASETDSAEDVPFNLQAFGRAKKVLYIEKPFYRWRCRETSLSNRHSAKALRGGATTSLIMSEYASGLPLRYQRNAIASAFRNMYWYYSFCIAEIRVAKSKGGDAREYCDALRYMRNLMLRMKREKSYPLLSTGYKLAVFFMIRFPRVFAFAWLIYRKLKNPSASAVPSSPQSRV